MLPAFIPALLSGRPILPRPPTRLFRIHAHFFRTITGTPPQKVALSLLPFTHLPVNTLTTENTLCV